MADIPKEYWGSSSAKYGQVSPTGQVEKTNQQIVDENERERKAREALKYSSKRRRSGGGARASSGVPSAEQVLDTSDPKDLINVAKIVSGEAQKEAQTQSFTPAIGKTKDNWRTKAGGAIADVIATPINALKGVAGYDNEGQREIEESDVRAASRRFVNIASFGLLSPGVTGSLTGTGQSMNVGADVVGGVVQGAIIGTVANKAINYAMNKWGKSTFIGDVNAKVTQQPEGDYTKFKAGVEGSGSARRSLGPIKSDVDVVLSGNLEGVSAGVKIPDSKVLGSVTRTTGQISTTALEEGKTSLNFVDDVIGGFTRGKSRTIIKTSAGAVKETISGTASAGVDLLKGTPEVSETVSRGVKGGGFFRNIFNTIFKGERTSSYVSGVMSGQKGIVDFKMLGNTLGTTASGSSGTVQIAGVTETLNKIASAISGSVTKAVASIPASVNLGGIAAPAVAVSIGISRGGGSSGKTIQTNPQRGGLSSSIVNTAKIEIPTSSPAKSRFPGWTGYNDAEAGKLKPFKQPTAEDIDTGFIPSEIKVNVQGTKTGHSHRSSRTQIPDVGQILQPEQAKENKLTPDTGKGLIPSFDFKFDKAFTPPRKLTTFQPFTLQLGGPGLNPPFGGFGIPKIDFGGLSGGRGTSVKGKAPTNKYSPSLLAQVFNIRGKKPGLLTGIEIRPFLTTGRRKKK